MPQLTDKELKDQIEFIKNEIQICQEQISEIKNTANAAVAHWQYKIETYSDILKTLQNYNE